MVRLTPYIANARKLLVLCAGMIALSVAARAQGINFSQFYHAPLLLNPANAGLMNDKDFRLGAQYRDQWKSIPAPFKTITLFGDTKLFQSDYGDNWMGLGLALFNDRAGDGELSLTRIESAIAYHLMVGELSMISVGLSGGAGYRRVNFNTLTFNEQWDGFRFDFARSNQEKNGLVRTRYYDVGAGINFAYFPSVLTYFKVGVGVAHVNMPVESFYGEPLNKLGIRPTLNIEGIFGLNESFAFVPSLYYTTQKSAYEFVFGSMTYTMIGGSLTKPTNLLIGGYYRWKEAAIVAFGIEAGDVKILSSYDYTTSGLQSQMTNGGAWELSLIYQGNYERGSRGKNVINCPRF